MCPSAIDRLLPCKQVWTILSRVFGTIPLLTRLHGHSCYLPLVWAACLSFRGQASGPSVKLFQQLSRYNDERDMAKELLFQHSSWLSNFRQQMTPAGVIYSRCRSFACHPCSKPVFTYTCSQYGTSECRKINQAF